MPKYDPSKIESRWQKWWEDQGTFVVPTEGANPKYYILDMFPYPSGNGLHTGHLKGYVASDVVARYKRMCGFDVLHPMGWDAFGLPAERQAVKEGIHPEEVTNRNTSRFASQCKKVGLSYDWSRELSTTDENYYRWTQWIFLKLYEKGLAYTAEVPVNWCPALNTVLANEEVKDGKYVETGDPVERRNMRQWMLKITAYADRLLDDLEGLDWPEGIKEMQRNWIGKSTGARVHFAIDGSDQKLEIFTTRPDTLFGCSFCILAPEHPLVEQITTADQKESIEAYKAEAQNKSERERIAQAEAKSGCFTGAYAVCPVNNKKVPVWIGDYVLMGYGTGAVFGCPAHDERDYSFAKTFDLPILEVIEGGDISKEAYTGDGPIINSEFLNGLDIETAKATVIEWLEKHNTGTAETQYRLRDWLFSRQRYWGEPIPMVLDPAGETHPVAESELPVTLPHLDKFEATEDGQPPLAAASEWVNTVVPESEESGFRETNTMPQWAGSCWYYLRFIDPNNQERFVDEAAEKRWMPIDFYIGGAEHAVLHLLYARFWHKVLYDLGFVSTNEPFQKLVNQGMITARSYRSTAGKYYYPHEVEKKGDEYFSKNGVGPLETQVEKMSKSRYNVTEPEDMIEQFGADSLRLYIMFMGPVTDGAEWQTENIGGVRRFLERAWRLVFSEENDDPQYLDETSESDEELDQLLHKTIKKVGSDIKRLQLNTAISQMMTFVNEASKRKKLSKETLEVFFRLLAPFAPHTAEEVWHALGNDSAVSLAKWPKYDESKATDDMLEIPIQINGKVRDRVQLSRGASKEEMESTARASEKITSYIEGKEVQKVVVVPDRLINFVVR